jgi:hypothetical protein
MDRPDLETLRSGKLTVAESSQAAERRPDIESDCGTGQIVGFQGDGMRRYLAPSFST